MKVSFRRAILSKVSVRFSIVFRYSGSVSIFLRCSSWRAFNCWISSGVNLLGPFLVFWFRWLFGIFCCFLFVFFLRTWRFYFVVSMLSLNKAIFSISALLFSIFFRNSGSVSIFLRRSSRCAFSIWICSCVSIIGPFLVFCSLFCIFCYLLFVLSSPRSVSVSNTTFLKSLYHTELYFSRKCVNSCENMRSMVYFAKNKKWLKTRFGMMCRTLFLFQCGGQRGAHAGARSVHLQRHITTKIHI